MFDAGAAEGVGLDTAVVAAGAGAAFGFVFRAAVGAAGSGAGVADCVTAWMLVLGGTEAVLGWLLVFLPPATAPMTIPRTNNAPIT